MAVGSDYGWAYIAQDILSSSGGPLGAIQFANPNQDISGSGNLTYDYATANLFLSGNLNVSGTINANALNIDVTNKTVTNISSTGSTKFGDSADDFHNFTGSVIISGSSNPLKLIGLLSGTLAGDGSFVGVDSDNNLTLTTVSYPVTAINNKADGRLVTIGSTTTELDGEANLTFANNILSLTGIMTASVGISSSLGQYTQITSSILSASNLHGDNVIADVLGGILSTAGQPNITSVGSLTELTVDSPTFLVKSATNRVGIGRTGPQRKLDVLDDGGTPQIRVSYDENNFSELQTTSEGYLYLSSSGDRVGIGTVSPTAMLSVSGTSHFSGNVGIGTTSPTKKLDVDGDVRIAGDLVVSGTLNAKVTDFVITANTLTFGDSATDSIVFNAASASLTTGLNIDSNTFVINSSNNRVGIGVEDPTYTLDVGGNIGVDEFIYHNDDDNTYLRFQADQAHIKAGGKSMIKMDEAAAESVILLNKDKDTIKVGIGTENPETDLHLSGAMIITETLAVTGSITGSAFTNGNVVIEGSDISGVNTLTATNLGGTLSTAAQPNITSVGSLVNLIADTTTLVVKSTTNRVGIGRTGPQRKLDVLDGGGSPQIRVSYDSNNFSELQTNDSGHLHISSSGERVGIGTSTPTNTLSVSGTLAVSGSLSINSGSVVSFKNLSLASATTSSFLALDANNNLILTSSGTTITEYVSASILNYTNHGNNRILTSVDSESVNGEANLTFDGSSLSVTGNVYASSLLSSSIGRHSELTSSAITDGTSLLKSGALSGLISLTSSIANITQLTGTSAIIDSLDATTIGGTLSTAAQPNITSVGSLVNLVADTTTLVVKSTTNRVGIGRTGPQRKLDVLNSAAEPQMRVSYDSSNFAELQTTSDGLLMLSASGGKIGIGTASPNHALTVDGDISASVNISASYFFGNGSKLTGIVSGISYSRIEVSGNYTASNADVLLGVTSSGTVEILLPLANTYTAGQYFTVKDESGTANINNITILTSGSNKIDGQSSVILESPYVAVNIYSNGTDKFFIY
jgi:sorbitol-specific phosphotransferase system component IIA